ncbi:HlyD family efflux transporter periplasmic adaptor subunit [Sphingomonas sp. ABOLD]|uniref:HlyD family secretion protein n=1 Tax=Sphingomonas trueperi TaxID=53317 RepID=A0A7X5Y155_9SPHN|nr:MULTISPECIES: efflux RND transporter periplasmic adaptor subunit [Sphingomonas]NJB99161.1 HlyD family secretion protein [Sphingomonas trueperi]RSV52451.1 HlyD family efflux transporter periplasmic adaptor subunit [Sphingomonas sp. ABOLD]
MTDETTAPPRRKPPILAIVLGIALVVLIVGGLWLANRPAPEQLQGMVDADEVNVATKALARVETLVAEEGQRVRAGTLLATLSSPEIAGGKAQAQGAVDAARAIASETNEGARQEDIASLRSTWQAAQAAADLAAVTSRRTANLYAQGVVAAQRRDEAAAAREASAKQAEAARQQYLKALAGARPQNKQAANAQVRIAEAALQTATALGRETQLVSPIDGEVSRKLVQPGEVVSPVIPAYQVLDIDHAWVALTVREDRFKGIAMGKRLRGHIPALGRDGDFAVYQIAARGDFATWRATRQASGYDVRAFEVKLRPAAAIPGLRPGMSVLFDWPQ